MKKQSSYRRIIAVIGSQKFFWGILVLFVLQAAWIACSGRFPMAFDEDFHLGIIRLYAHHLSPLWSFQPSGADAYGAVFRDPSYLYHWLMSFPYRLIHLFTSDQTVIVLWLRAINIGLFAGGLAVSRRLLLRTGASQAIVNGCLLVFVLIPVVPLLAAQVNYDNLFFLLVALVLLRTVQFTEELTRKKRVNSRVFLEVIILCAVTSLVKYAFLPILVALAIYLETYLRRTFKKPSIFWWEFRAGLKRLGRLSSMALILGVVVGGGLFIERYAINMVRYHNPVPDCSKALSVEACSAYGPWYRDHYLEAHKSPAATRNPAIFANDWFYGMWLRLFFAVDGPATNFQTKGPFIVPAISAIVFVAASITAVLVYAKRLFKKYNNAVLTLFLVVAGVYIGVLWLDGYRTFLRVGQAVAINGRYLFPVLLPLMLISVLAINEFCREKQGLKLFICGIALVSLLWGGGALTYILRSENTWYWPGTPLSGANEMLRRDIGPYVPGYRHPTEFLGRN